MGAAARTDQALVPIFRFSPHRSATAAPVLAAAAAAAAVAVAVVETVEDRRLARPASCSSVGASLPATYRPERAEDQARVEGQPASLPPCQAGRSSRGGARSLTRSASSSARRRPRRRPRRGRRASPRCFSCLVAQRPRQRCASRRRCAARARVPRCARAARRSARRRRGGTPWRPRWRRRAGRGRHDRPSGCRRRCAGCSHGGGGGRGRGWLCGCGRRCGCNA